VHWQTGGPVDITGVGEIVRKMLAKDIYGFEINLIWYFWATQGPLYYLLGQLTWNPDRQVDEIMEDYYKAGFGPAAEDIKAYWTMLENNRREQGGGKSWAEAFSPEFFKEAYSLLDKAAVKTANDGNQYSDRIAFIRAGLDYLRLNTENQAYVKQILASKEPDPALKEKMRANWKQIEDISKKYPEALGRIGKNNLGYIHPEADHKGIEEKRLRKAKHAEKKKSLNEEMQGEEE